MQKLLDEITKHLLVHLYINQSFVETVRIKPSEVFEYNATRFTLATDHRNKTRKKTPF